MKRTQREVNACLTPQKVSICGLNGPFHKYGHVRSKGFFGQTRQASDEHIPQWICKERATKSVELPPGGLRRIWPVAALLVGYRPTTGYAPSSRLATGQIGRNERGRIYENGPLRQGEEGYIALALLNNTNG